MIQRPFLTQSSQRGISPQSLEEMSQEYLVMGLQTWQKEGERINIAIISLRIDMWEDYQRELVQCGLQVS